MDTFAWLWAFWADRDVYVVWDICVFDICQDAFENVSNVKMFQIDWLQTEARVKKRGERKEEKAREKEVWTLNMFDPLKHIGNIWEIYKKEGEREGGLNS